tara:strand:+ start:56 stop:250 length:195 start_codon:yes stop_codon:yes gene_type:complete
MKKQELHLVLWKNRHGCHALAFRDLKNAERVHERMEESGEYTEVYSPDFEDEEKGFNADEYMWE